MTTADAETAAGSAASDQSEARMRVDTLFESLGERLNPILVKEARQALKSKQFVITFMLLLACGWGWSILGIALQAGAVYYAESGAFMLGGYFIVLAVPLMVIVPFAAFRSIAAEKDYGTFELLSITSLNSRQIVTGKLAVSILQMLVYLSALAPFLAFTYLLRGVDLIAILFVLGYTVLLSLLFSSVGIMAGTLSRTTHWQVVLSVVFLALVGGSTIMWIAFVLDEVLDDSGPFSDPGFLVGNAIMIVMALSYVVVSIVAAASRVSFASDNRSTPIRVALMLQQAVWIWAMLYGWLHFRDDDFFIPMVMLAVISWGIVGALMTSEMGELSTRVKRTLPRSALGRVMLTWFFPGSGTGYVFAVCNFAALYAVALVASMSADFFDLPGRPRGNSNPALIGFLYLGYLAAYLGLGRLIVLGIRSRYPIGLFGGAIVHVVLVIVGAVVPTVFQLLLHRFFGSDYTPLQAPNWAWTTDAVMSSNFSDFDAVMVGGAVSLTAAAVFLVNLMYAVKEVEQVRIATPSRVREELQGERGPQRRPGNPWDEDESAEDGGAPEDDVSQRPNVAVASDSTEEPSPSE